VKIGLINTLRQATDLAPRAAGTGPQSPVHDEIILEVDENHGEEATDWLMSCMSEAVKEVTSDPETPVVVEVETRSCGEDKYENHSHRRGRGLSAPNKAPFAVC